MRLRVRQVVLAVTAVAAALVAASGASATRFEPATKMLPSIQISDAAAKASKTVPTCPNGLVCYHPSFLQEAYDFPGGRHAPTGAGQTILVVTSYGLPSVASDLAQFDAEESLPPADLTVVQQHAPAIGQPADPDTIRNWMLETALDVEYAHAMAPGAKIVLAVAATDDSADVTQTLSEVLPHQAGAIVSLSLFADEFLFANSDPDSLRTMSALFAKHVLGGGTVVAAAGDFGASGYSPQYAPAPFQAAAFPASSPFAIGVGGTMGGDYPYGLWVNGGYGSEQVWNEPDFGGATGGGPSKLFAAPVWQFGLTGTFRRATPDVAYNAALNGGVVVVVNGRHTVMGGTSVGTPQWAAIVALANELRGRQGRLPLGLTTPNLYLLARDFGSYRQDFHDITVGNNALGGDPTQMPGFTAGRGYDFATGLGTPDVARLLKDLAGRDGGRFGVSDNGFEGDSGKKSGREHVHVGG
ncbi:MAG TPA: S53 family peptidase [Gaiellaceae bacterium]|nr:S53 family peptidase [Gaiellaceae bacterium]